MFNMANKFDNLIGKEVRVVKAQGANLFNVGDVYTVTGTGVCGYGVGVTTEEKGRIYVLAEGNFEVVAEFKPTAVRPAPLDLKGFLTALQDEEGVVSIDGDDDVTDTYYSLEGLADDLCSFEVTDNQFYLEEDWEDYQRALEADRRAEAKAKDLTFEEALALLAEGTAVTSFDDDGDEVDTYHTVKDLAQLAGFEIEAVWRKA